MPPSSMRLIAVQGGIEFHRLPFARQGFDLAGRRIAAEQQIRLAGELSGLDDAGSVLAIGVITPAEAADKDASPGLEAIDTFRNGEKSRNAVENRFFLKQERFEISPVVGYVPNNPFLWANDPAYRA